MKTLTESIIGRKGINYSRIVPKLEKALDNNTEIEELAEKHGISFNAMRDIFNKIKNAVIRLDFIFWRHHQLVHCTGSFFRNYRQIFASAFFRRR